jgi:hypothetical protein
MRKSPVFIALLCLTATATIARAQSNQKPGLWEMTSTMTWQKSPLPPGMSMPAGGNSPFGGGPRTTQVCLTKEMIDKYGMAPPQQGRNNQCQMSNIVKKGNGMSADWVCTGMMAGKGTVTAEAPDPDHSTSKVHFVGSMQMGPNATPVEYTIESSSVYKGADCGSTKPLQMPKE